MLVLVHFPGTVYRLAPQPPELTFPLGSLSPSHQRPKSNPPFLALLPEGLASSSLSLLKLASTSLFVNFVEKGRRIVTGLTAPTLVHT